MASKISHLSPDFMLTLNERPISQRRTRKVKGGGGVWGGGAGNR